jgi:peptide chain release factor 1
MNGDIQKIVDELALVNNMEKLKEASEVFKKIDAFIKKIE